MKSIKDYIPITISIIITTLLIGFGILALIGIVPFTKKNKDVGITLICIGILCGFYLGLCIGNLIIYLVNKCTSAKTQNINFDL